MAWPSSAERWASNACSQWNCDGPTHVSVPALLGNVMASQQMDAPGEVAQVGGAAAQ